MIYSYDITKKEGDLCAKIGQIPAAPNPATVNKINEII